MAVLVFLNWPGVTREVYEQLRASVNWAEMRPNGANLHMSSFDENGGLHVVDHWDSVEQFQAFVQQQLAPAAAAAGITDQAEVGVYPVAYVDQFDKLGT